MLERLGPRRCTAVIHSSGVGLAFAGIRPLEFSLRDFEDTALRDKFGFANLREGRYTSSEMDGGWTEAIEAEYQEWRKTHGLED